MISERAFELNKTAISSSASAISRPLNALILSDLQPKCNNFFEEDNSEKIYDLLKTDKFIKQLSMQIEKIFLQNFINFKKIQKLSFVECKYDYILLLSFAIELSIIQRDFINQSYKYTFFENTTPISNQSSVHNKKNDGSNILRSGSILFKTKVFNKQKSSHSKNITEMKKFFALTRKVKTSEYQSNIFSRPLNLFIFFTDLEIGMKSLQVYIKNLPNISLYKFNNGKFNKDIFIEYLISNNYGIIVIEDIELLSKNEIDIIYTVYNTGEIALPNNFCTKLNLTFWICADFTRNLIQN